MNKRIKILGIILIVLIVAVIGLLVIVICYHNPDDAKLRAAGIEEKQVQVGAVSFHSA